MVVFVVVFGTWQNNHFSTEPNGWIPGVPRGRGHVNLWHCHWKGWEARCFGCQCSIRWCFFHGVCMFLLFANTIFLKQSRNQQKSINVFCLMKIRCIVLTFKHLEVKSSNRLRDLSREQNPMQSQVRLHRILHSSVQELLGDSLMEAIGITRQKNVDADIEDDQHIQYQHCDSRKRLFFCNLACLSTFTRDKWYGITHEHDVWRFYRPWKGFGSLRLLTQVDDQVEIEKKSLPSFTLC